MAEHKYSNRSRDNLLTVQPRFAAVFFRVLPVVDHSILCGHRSKAEQDLAYAQGYSQLKFPDSNHNLDPSEAVDAMPFPIVWPSQTASSKEKLHALERIYFFAGAVLTAGYLDGLIIKWGGDWDMDIDFSDQTFNDLAHYELVSILGE